MDDPTATSDTGFADAKKADSLLFDAVEARQLHAHVRSRIFGEADPVRIGRYTVLERIGQGGMGVVYAAFDNKLDRKIALKLMRRRDPASHARTLREAKAMARLSHPNVVQVHDVGEWRDRVFIAMEFVRGVTLGQWRTQVDDPDRLLDALQQAGAGLAAAHEAGIVHRDFKSDNILVASDGRVRVVDFGIARTELAERMPTADYARVDVDLTATGTVVGTPAYMAPEQFLGGSVDARADQWAFGVVVHETLVGARPFEAEDFGSLREAVLAGRRRPIETKLPAQVTRVLDRALQREPEDRYPSMVALLLDLRPAPRHTAQLTLAGLIVALLFVAGFVTFKFELGDTLLDRSRAEAAQLAKRAEGAEKTLAERDDALALREARQALQSDPTMAVEALAELSPEGWNEEARCILAEAQARGVADTIWTDGRRWPEPPTFDRGVLTRYTDRHHVVAIDPATLEEKPLPDVDAAVVADGDLIASCSLSELWLGAPNRTLLSRLTLPDDFVSYLVGAGGHAVALTTATGVETYEARTVRPIAELDLPGVDPGKIHAVTPDGRTVLAIVDDTLVRIDAGGIRTLAPAERGPVRVSADGRYVTAVVTERQLAAWTLDGDEVMRVVDFDTYALAPEGDWLAYTLGREEGGVGLRNLADESARGFRADHPVRSLKFSRDGRWLVATGKDEVTVWDVKTGMRRPSTWRYPIVGWALDEQAGILTIVDSQATRVQWDLIDESVISVDTGSKGISALAYVGEELVSGSYDGEVRRWPGPGQPVMPAGDAERAINDVRADGEDVGVTLAGGGARFFHAGAEVGRLENYTPSAAVALSLRARMIARASLDGLERLSGDTGSAMLYECQGCRSDNRGKLDLRRLIPDLTRGESLVTTRLGGQVVWWKEDEPRPHRLDLPGDRIYAAQTDDAIATKSWDGEVIVFDLDGEPLAEASTDGIKDVLAHPRAGHLLVLRRTGDLAWWQAEAGPPCGLGRPFDGLTTATVSKDEREIGIGLNDGRLVRMPMPSALSTEDPAGLVRELLPETIGADGGG